MDNENATPKAGRVRKQSKAASTEGKNGSEAPKATKGSTPAKRAKPKTLQRNPVGRPSSYDPAKHPQQAYKLCLLGLIDERIADVIGVSYATLSKWKVDHPEFSEAMKDGKERADANVAVSLYQRACGYSHMDVDIKVIDGEIVETPLLKQYPPDTKAADIWLRNRHPALFRERTITEISGLDGAPIEMVHATTDYAALREKIKAKKEAA